MSTRNSPHRLRTLLLRLLPWLMGMTIGASVIYLQNAGTVRTDREVLLQLPRMLPKGYDGNVGVRAFVYDAADSGDPQLLTPKAELFLSAPTGRKSSVGLLRSAVGGLEGTVALPEPVGSKPLTATLLFELAGEMHELRAVVNVGEEGIAIAHEEKRNLEAKIGEQPFMPRFGGCVAGRPCANAYAAMEPWPESKWRELAAMPVLPRYAVAIEGGDLQRDESGVHAKLHLVSDGPFAVDRFTDGVWDYAGSQTADELVAETKPGKASAILRYQFRPDPFDVGAASTFEFDPSEPPPTALELAKREASIYGMPTMWSWTAQQKQAAAGAATHAKTFFMGVIAVCAIGAIAILLLRWKSTKPAPGVVSDDDARLLIGRSATLVAGVFALVLLFLLVIALYLMRDFIVF